MFESLIQGVLIGASAGFSPGPLLALIMVHSVRSGWRRTLPIALAPLLSDGPIILIVLLLLSRVPDGFVSVLRVAGGIFLLYLAWDLFSPAETRATPEPPAGEGSILRTAVLINLLNPNPYLFWATVIGPSFVAAWRVNPVHGLSYVAGFYATMIAVFIFWIITFATARQLSTDARRTLTRASGIILAGFGLWQLIAGFGLV